MSQILIIYLMPEVNWMKILESQQDEFIIKLKERMPAFTRSKYDFDEAIHLYSLVDLDDIDLTDKLNWFCQELTYKYYGGYSDYFPDEFINYKIGKIGEESVKQYLGKLISNVNYELYEWGDDGTDFYLTNNKSVKLQVKTTCFSRILEENIDYEYEEDEYEYFCVLELDYVNLEHDECQKILDGVKWKISEKEHKKNQICIFVLLLNQVVGDRMHNYVEIKEIDKEFVSYINHPVYDFDCNGIYSSILCGFKPTNLLKPNTDIYLKDLFYIGGLKGYLLLP
ncbi:MAG: hypothetical protein F6K48_17495, partial [Okeania sp. SIO3H1]|nr:hypothetical protein [Okeania sp. SIO3H1]